MTVSFDILGPDRALKLRQLLRFAVVGVFNTLFGYGVIFGCMYLAGMTPVVSNLIGYGVGLLLAYKLHRNFTFGSVGAQRREAARFLIVFGLAYSANLGVLFFLTHVVRMSGGSSQVFSGTVYVVSSFLLSRYFVFTEIASPATLTKES